ncbi:sensor domain-containing diguanylate cyclase [Poseidonibacter ostreae]|jgi:diguanylate cyclase (GGDEF)-like protein|uniref:diguanylate cyclase n=1 Tax=Poseidonibacter ostreae TaxID=2654171 RepID=A0A6L4WTD2_9BACT|nr:diguanylate cyclase [Poseidonibacter ostreae]KAB7889443.1 diguanylate cyclase [Poseidonibacter ostreae]KAB7892544.1 diguanylate cyclase [Poseidonibacter ostreae]
MAKENFFNIKNITTALLLSFAYILLGILSMNYASMVSGIAIAWLPNSLLLAFFLLKNSKEWKYYIPFFIVAEIIADYPSFTFIQSLQFAFINIFETTVAAFLIKKITDYKKNFTNTKYVIAFFLIALNIMPSISGILGATVYSTQIVENSTFFEFWRIWYFGDAVGILLLTPILVMTYENYKTFKNYSLNIQNTSTVIFTIILAVVLFSFNNDMTVLPTTPLIFILILLWIVYKQGILPSLIISLLITIIAIYFTTNSIGPFAIFSEKETTIFLQEFISLLVIIPLFVGILLREITDSNKKLIELNSKLEEKVKEKTKSLIESNEKLTLLASKDPLTNIYNRRMLNEYILQETVKAKRHKTDVSLILLDIDHFKDTNDKFGHQVGDEVLIEISSIISKNIRESDIFGRWGGEEFIIILPQTSIKNAYEVAESLRKKVENHSFEKVGKKTISLGVSMYNTKQDILEFIENTDRAMYKAKYSGRNKVEYFEY